MRDYSASIDNGSYGCVACSQLGASFSPVLALDTATGKVEREGEGVRVRAQTRRDSWFVTIINVFCTRSFMLTRNAEVVDRFQLTSNASASLIDAHIG